ncbi:MAG: SdrD B-like domain-containing protein [bacterium]
MRNARGFSAVEALVALVVLSVVTVATVQIFQTSQKSARRASVQGDTQQSSRVVMNNLSKDLRSAGFGTDELLGQPALAHAGAWDIVFNANILPAVDDIAVPGFPRAIDPSRGPGSVPPGGTLYQPAAAFDTGAETVRYTLDSNGDGSVGEDDDGDDEEEATPNPRDYVLRKEIYGALADGTNGGAGEPVGLVRGPVADADGTMPTPLFSYWIDDDVDPDTDAVLHGDLDGDGALSQSEIVNLGDVPTAQLSLVSRVIVTVITEDGESLGGPKYRSRTLETSVSMRNPFRTTGTIVGTVYMDMDSDAVADIPEPGIPNVKVRLATGEVRTTDSVGRFAFEVVPGTHTVEEIDPPGHVSTSPNVLELEVPVGTAVRADFGDRPLKGVGGVQGMVFDDADLNATLDSGERGIANVVVHLSNGLVDTTDADGKYAVMVPVGTYKIVEADPAGWHSTTPNEVQFTLAADGEKKTVNFGDVHEAIGTIKGTVYVDADGDGVLDVAEPGLADVAIYLSTGEKVLTDKDGGYLFETPAGVYSITEWDPDGYSSSTPNVVTAIAVLPNEVLVVDFGDVHETVLEFDEVDIGRTQGPLSILAIDLGEDALGDPDIVLGTDGYSTENNVLVWHNQRTGAQTALDRLFDVVPTFTRNASSAVAALIGGDANEDSRPDVITGLDAEANDNMSVWVTQSGAGAEGTLPMFPSASLQTRVGSTVKSLAFFEWPGGQSHVLAIGTSDGNGTGHVEIWKHSGSGTFAYQLAYDIQYRSGQVLGEVTGLAVADFDGDGYPDLAVGQDDGIGGGEITVFVADQNAPLTWTESVRLPSGGAIRALVACDMVEDDGRDFDVVAGSSAGTGRGVVEVWLNDGTGALGEADHSGGVQPDVSETVAGEVLSLAVEHVDADVFPDVIVGSRTSPYAGELVIHHALGNPSGSAAQWSSRAAGEVVAVAIGDLNQDAVNDVIVGARTTSSSGELSIYFGHRGGN